MTIYTPEKTYIVNGCFYSTGVQNVDLQQTPFANDTARSTFASCSSLISCSNMVSNVVDINACFSECSSLTSYPDFNNFYSVMNMRACFTNCRYLTEVPSLPKQCTLMEYCFENCIRLASVPNVIPMGTVNMARCFYNCANLGVVNIHIPNSVSNTTSCFYNCNKMTGNLYFYNTELNDTADIPRASVFLTLPIKNVYLPFKYDNGVNTVIYNKFKSYYSSPSDYNVYLYNIKTTPYWNGAQNPWYQNSSTFHYGRVLPSGV